jgi:cytochrome b6-f complex iron-sulfur subunit
MSEKKDTNDVGKHQPEQQRTEGQDTSQTTSSKPVRPRKPKQDKPPENDPGIWRMNRRNALTFAGWLAFLGFIATAVIGFLRYLFPRVLFEPPTAFRAGHPDDYVVGEVDTRWMDQYRVWVVRTRTGVYALRAVCTHLGCTPRWLDTEGQFKCPCHGSGFTRDGINFEGPAPRPLERLHISMEAGEIIIDRGIRYRQEMGEWNDPGAFLPYT